MYRAYHRIPRVSFSRTSYRLKLKDPTVRLPIMWFSVESWTTCVLGSNTRLSPPFVFNDNWQKIWCIFNLWLINSQKIPQMYWLLLLTFTVQVLYPFFPWWNQIFLVSPRFRSLHLNIVQIYNLQREGQINFPSLNNLQSLIVLMTGIPSLANCGETI